MRKKLMTAVLVVMTLLAPGLVPPAAASNAWISIGTVFRIGAAHVAIALGSPFGYEPAYYYRYDQPIHYRGVSCSRYCFHEGAYDYHHESCPLVAAHFSQYRVDPRWAFDNYAPHYDGRYRDGYGYDRYSDRYDRRGYDRYDRYDDRGRYDDHGRYDRGYDRYDRYDRYYDRDRRDDRGRGHRHYKGCGHGY